MGEPVIKAEGLSKYYGGYAALNSLSVDIPEGGLVGLIGRNGSGKTTLMKLCAGQLEISKGTLKVCGGVPMDNLSVLSHVVYACHNMTYENQLQLRYILNNYAIMFPGFDLVFASNLLKYFDLSPKSRYNHLSQGMMSVFNFICGLACRAKLTLFDEPVLGMDVTVRRSIYEILLRDYTEHRRTIIVSSHLLAEVEGVLSDILLIDKGQLVLFSTLDDLRQSAYRVEGEKQNVDAYCAGKAVIYRKDTISSEAVIREPFDEGVADKASLEGLRVSAVRPEDLCVYLTRPDKESELECLWQETN